MVFVFSGVKACTFGITSRLLGRFRSLVLAETRGAGSNLPDNQTTGGAVCARCVPPASLLDLTGQGVESLAPSFPGQNKSGGFDGLPVWVSVPLGAAIWAALIVMAVS